MKTIFIGLGVSFLSLFAGLNTTQAQQQFKWVKGGGTIDAIPSGGTEESVQYMCTDPNGNVYALNVVGANPITADTFSHPACGFHNNILLTSYKCDGTMRWAKLINGSDDDVPSGIAADNAGHIYVSGNFGHFYGSTNFHVGYDTTITGYIYLTEGLIQLDTSGNYKWIRFIGTNTLATLAAMSDIAPVAVDGANNIHQFPYVAAGVPFMTGVTSIGGVYDLTYNPSGTLLSAVRLDLDSQWECKSAVIDPVTNKLYLTGEINQYIFGGFLTDTFYAASFDISRHKLWQYFFGGNSGALQVVLNQDKHLYFAGGSGGTTFSFNGSSVPAGDLAVVMKTDTNGTVNWMKRFSVTGSGVNGFNAITALPNNKIAAFGTFAGTVTDGTISLSTPPGEGYTPYFIILDSAMNMQTAQQLHGNGFYNGSDAITADKVGNIYLGGEVVDSVWATGPKIPAYHSVGGGTDFFVMKYGVDCSCTSMPVSSFSYSGTHKLSVSYTGTSTGLDSVVWSFGDGSATVKGLTAIHTYSLAGAYRVTATVFTGCGNDIHGENVVIICGAPPVAALTATGMPTVSFTYTGTTSTVDSTVWNFGDGSATVKSSTAIHSYTAVGVYTACVTAWSGCGNNTACKTVTIVCVAAPTSSFTKTGTSSLSTVYTGTTTSLDSVVWRFGDGSPTVRGNTAAHTYTAPGTYTVCATAYSRCGSDTFCLYDTITCLIFPKAAFSDTGKHKVGFTYTGTTTGIDSIVWDFGDGTKATGATPFHSYALKGTYHVCVKAYTSCSVDSVCHDVTVTSLGIASTSETDIRVFPNPSTDELNVTGVTENTLYRLLAVTGMCMAQGILNPGSNIIAMRQYAGGVYVLEMTSLNGQRTMCRIVKQ